MGHARRNADYIIRFGSLTARLRGLVERCEDVAWIFGTSLQPPSSELLGGVEADVTVSDLAPDPGSERPPVPADGMILRHDPCRPEIHTEALSAFLDLGAAPLRVDIAICQPPVPHFDLRVHLAVVCHKVLFLLDRVVLHAAGVQLGDRVSLFQGDKGAGKSTITLKLARSGATVLGDDHLVLRRTSEGFRVSGCDERSRLDARTERHFFDQPLSSVPRDFGGTLKKEIPARGLFASQPYTDHRADLLFFNHVGGAFRITPLPHQVALVRLMRATGRLQRFVDPTDRRRLLDMLSDFVETVTAYDVALSEDLHELDRLVEFLRDEVPAGRA